MKYFSIDLEGKEIEFRMVSADILELEKKTGTPMQQYIQKVSNTSCVTILKYMRKPFIQNISEKDANILFDELVDSGYSLESIYMDIIFPACVVSGIITEEDYEKIKNAVNEKGDEEIPNPPQK